MPSPRRRWSAALVAMPAVLVPLIEVPLVIWARSTFLALNPDYVDDPPTISRAINDPAVGVLFSNLILVITALLMLVVPVIVWSYALAIARVAPGGARRNGMHVLLLLFLLFQLAASTGMVLTTQFTFDTDHHMHMVGSYIFFFFQALAIVVAATLCRMLHRGKAELGIADAEWQFRPFMHRVRFRFAMLIVGLVAFYGVLFVAKDHALPFGAYMVQVLYTQCEVIVIGCYVLFLGTYAVDIYDSVQHGRLKRRLAAPAPPAVEAGKPTGRPPISHA